jgi:hypothetical protein
MALVKGRTKAIRTRAGVIVHREKSDPNFVKRERPDQRGSLGRGEGRRRHKGEKVEGAGSVNRLTKKVFEKIMKDRGLSRVGEDLVAIFILKVFNLVLPQAAGCAKVEVPRVFVPEGAVLNFCTLPPVGGPVKVLLAQMELDHRTKPLLERGEGPRFFQPVQERDDRAAIAQIN